MMNKKFLNLIYICCMHLLESTNLLNGLRKFMSPEPYTAKPKIRDLTNQDQILKPALELIERNRNLPSESDFGSKEITKLHNSDTYKLTYVGNEKRKGIFLIRIVNNGIILIQGTIKTLAVELRFLLGHLCDSSDPAQLSFYTDERQFKVSPMEYRVLKTNSPCQELSITAECSLFEIMYALSTVIAEGDPLC